MNILSIDEIQNELIDEFAPIEDWMDRYSIIIDMGKELDPLTASEKTKENLIEGCQSRVWIVPYKNEEGKLFFKADSDALIVKGIAAMLLRIVNFHLPEEIANANLFFIEKIGLSDHLSPTRNNGLFSMIDQIKRYANLENN